MPWPGNECVPAVNTAVVKLQAPVVVLAVVVPSDVPKSNTVTIALFSALPLTVIVVALVTPSVVERARVRCDAADARCIRGRRVDRRTEGAGNAAGVARHVLRRGGEGMGSGGQRRRVEAPGSGRCIGGRGAQGRAPSSTVTIALASAVPLTVIVVALVTPSVAERPVSAAMPLMLGAAGAVVSIVAAKADEALPVLPARSCAVAVKEWAPAGQRRRVEAPGPGRGIGGRRAQAGRAVEDGHDRIGLGAARDGNRGGVGHPVGGRAAGIRRRYR